MNHVIGVGLDLSTSMKSHLSHYLGDRVAGVALWLMNQWR